jgi:hypothetical protein
MSTKLFSKPFLYIIIFITIVAFIIGYVWREESRPHILEMYIFDLKSSQAIFIRTPNDKRILINGGVNSDIIRELTKVLPFYSRRIDTIISTGTEGKNISGLIDVLKRYSIDKVILPAITLESLGLSTTTDQIYSVFLDTIKEKGIAVEKVKVGDRIVFDSVFADILFPVPSELFKYSKASAPELVMNISYGDNSVIFLNDVTPKIQKFIASSTLNSSAAMEPALPGASLSGAERLRTRGWNVPAIEAVNILVIFNNASADNLASELTDKLKPKYLIYSKSLTDSNSKSTASKKDKIDPLFYLLADYRFNIKEKGTVKISSDGSSLNIE